MRESKVYFEKGLPVFAEGKTRKNDKLVVKDLLGKVFSCLSGYYEFYEQEALDSDLPKFHYDFYNLIFEGARRYYRLDLLVGHVQKFQDHVVVRNVDYFEKIKFIEFTPEEERVLNEIDDQKTVADLIASSRELLEKVFQILWALQFMELVKFD